MGETGSTMYDMLLQISLSGVASQFYYANAQHAALGHCICKHFKIPMFVSILYSPDFALKEIYPMD